jgi:hypothetical protein
VPSQNELMDDAEVHYPQGFVMMGMGWAALALGNLALGFVGLNRYPWHYKTYEREQSSRGNQIEQDRAEGVTQSSTHRFQAEKMGTCRLSTLVSTYHFFARLSYKCLILNLQFGCAALWPGFQAIANRPQQE